MDAHAHGDAPSLPNATALARIFLDVLSLFPLIRNMRRDNRRDAASLTIDDRRDVVDALLSLFSAQKHRIVETYRCVRVLVGAFVVRLYARVILPSLHACCHLLLSAMRVNSGPRTVFNGKIT